MREDEVHAADEALANTVPEKPSLIDFGEFGAVGGVGPPPLPNKGPNIPFFPPDADILGFGQPPPQQPYYDPSCEKPPRPGTGYPPSSGPGYPPAGPNYPPSDPGYPPSSGSQGPSGGSGAGFQPLGPGYSVPSEPSPSCYQPPPARGPNGGGSVPSGPNDGERPGAAGGYSLPAAPPPNYDTLFNDHKPTPAPRAGGVGGIAGKKISPDAFPDLPDVPTFSPSDDKNDDDNAGGGNKDESIDFDDLAKRFEALKKRK